MNWVFRWTLLLACAIPSPSFSQSLLTDLYFSLPNGGSDSVAGGDLYGTSMARIPDADSDGVDDIAVGIPGDNANRVRIYSGADPSQLITEISDTGLLSGSFGVSVAGIENLNAQFGGEVIIGVPGSNGPNGQAGRVDVRDARSGHVIYAFHGPSNNSSFGYSVDNAGDVNGDGVEDIVVGALLDDPNGASSGSCWVYSGATGLPLMVAYGGMEQDGFGVSVAGVGDVDSDGKDDIACGSAEGYVRVVAYDTAFVRNARQIHQVDVGSGFGWTIVAGPSGFVDGDHHADFMAAAGFEDHPDGGILSGVVRVYSGADATVIHEWWGDQADQLGRNIGVLDFDGNGVMDFWVGGGSYFQFFSGADGRPMARIEDSTAPIPAFGLFGGSLGDLNGDGRHEFAAGFPYSDFSSSQDQDDSGGVRIYRYELPSVGVADAACPNVATTTGEPAILSVHEGFGIDPEFEFRITGLPPGHSIELFSGDQQVQISQGIGVRCVGGNMNRLGMATANALGEVVIRLRQSQIRGAVPGATLHFQAVFDHFAVVNFSSAVGVMF